MAGSTTSPSGLLFGGRLTIRTGTREREREEMGGWGSYARTCMVLPGWRGVASAKTRSPARALRWWLMLSWMPATRRYPEATCAPMLASASAISADTPPWSTLNGCQSHSRPLLPHTHPPKQEHRPGGARVPGSRTR